MHLLRKSSQFLVIRGRLLPLTKNATNGTYAKYYPSVAFLPSVALGTLLTTNLFFLNRLNRLNRPICLIFPILPIVPLSPINKSRAKRTQLFPSPFSPFTFFRIFARSYEQRVLHSQASIESQAW